MIKYQTYNDLLTGLPNRTQLIRRLQLELAEANRQGRKLRCSTWTSVSRHFQGCRRSPRKQRAGWSALMLPEKIKIFVIGLMLLGVFVIELLTPLGYAEWVLYFIPFIIASRLIDRLSILLLSAFIIVLIVAGFFISPAGSPIVALSNRFFGILAILLITYVTTQRMRADEEIRQLAHHDPLTGLPNRRLFMEIADLDLARARRDRKRAGILYLDLDRFKEINDTFGHEAGDQLLKQVAARLTALLRKADSVARMGGDEFNIFLSEINTAADAMAIARKIVAPSGTRT